MCDTNKSNDVNELESPGTEEAMAVEPNTTPEDQAELSERRVDPEELDAIVAEVKELESSVAELQRESYKDQIIGKMQSRISELEPYESTVKQFRRSIMLLFDLVEKIELEYEEATREGKQPSAEQYLLDLNVLRTDIETQIFTAGLALYRTSTDDLKKGPALDIRRQRAVRAVPAESPEEHLIVIQSIRAGFHDENGRAVRKEEVVVKKYGAAALS